MSDVPLQNERIREHNRLLVYQSIKKMPRERLSRNDISRATGLSVPTVSTMLQDFARLGLIEEVGQSSARGGRPAQLISFKPDAYGVLSVDLAQTHYQAALIDLLGTPQQRFTGPEGHARGEHDLLEWLSELAAELAASHKIGHLAIAVPGVVEPMNGHVHLAPALGWHDYPLAEHLEERLGFKVTLENDVNALAVAELHYGQGSDCTNVVYLSVTSGIGLGIVIDGQIYRGSNSAAGEIGYSTLNHIEAQSLPNFGQPGPLEAHLLKLTQSFRTDRGIDLGSDSARQAFGHFCTDLTVILQNAICLLNPERLVVSWPDDSENLLCQHLEAHLRTPIPIQVTPAALGADGALIGVARLALDALETRLCSTQREATP